jgi:SSS family solute:Na+ symporter
MAWIDWAIMAVAVVALRVTTTRTRHCVRSVADFLSANRSAGRYLLTISSQMGGLGIISIVAIFEVGYQNGFPPGWWQMMSIPVGVVILLSGWVYYRFRETRALTMAQFLEMRYSRRFRIFAGIVMWVSGVLNFGIFPAVAARFFIYFCGLPEQVHVYHLHLSMFALIMAADLAVAVAFVNIGGQVSAMITECVQGIFCSFAFIAIAVYILLSISWADVTQAYVMASAPNASMLHPFRTSHVKDFNFWFYLIGVVGSFYGYMSWQGAQGFNSAAKSPHEQKMSGIIAGWRSFPQGVMVTSLIMAAVVLMHLDKYSSVAASVNSTLAHINNATIEGQMRVPVAMAYFLPAGIKGLLATIMLFASFTCHDTYMHSWGTIFIQDVYMPIKRRALEPHEHIRLLRWSIVGVAVFAFFFSLLYPPNEPIFMFFAITGTIWAAGAGAAIIGGLYWKRGTAAGAYCAVTLGAILGSAVLVGRPIYKSIFHGDIPVNNQQIFFIAACAASIVYVVVSLLTSRKGREFDLDRMLCRGEYASACKPVSTEKEPNRWQQLVGITKEFSFSDKILAVAQLPGQPRP